MKKMILAAALVAALCSLVSAQDTKTLPPAAISQKVIAPAIPGRPPLMAPDWSIKPSKYPPFCPKKTCLYYAGDFDSNGSNADGLFNANDSGDGIEAQVWVGVLPTKAATITGSTFNQFFVPGFTGTNPTPFQIRTGITTGKAGKLTCNTSGNATMVAYGESDFGFVQYSYTIKKLKKACEVKSGKQGASYVNMLPTSSNSYGYLASTDGAGHVGWPNDPNDCYFNGAVFGDTYQPCSSQGSAEFLSIALTGTE
jgi:hypothetical protein